MYGYRSGLFTRLLMGLCLFVWGFVGVEIALCADVVVFGGVRYFVSAWVGIQGTLPRPEGGSYTLANTGGVCPPYGLYNGVLKKHYSNSGSGNCWYKSATLISQTAIVDSDGDLLENSLDPCPDAKDSSTNVNIAKNRCTGEWYSMIISGSCEIDEASQTGFKKYYNPNLTVANRNAAIANAKATGCYAYDAKNFTPGSYQNWWESVYASSNSTAPTAATPGETVEPADVLNLNSNSTAPPTEASSDPEMQKILQQIDRLQNSITENLHSASENIGAKVVGASGKIVDAINGISSGGSDAGVVSAVGSASGTAHGDATALLGAVNGMIAKLGNSTGSSVPGLTLDELKSENEKIYSTEGGIGLDSSLHTGSDSIVGAISLWITTLRSRLDSIMPESSVNLVAPTSCFSFGGSITDARGVTYPLNEYCFGPYESSFELVGNALFSVVSIIAFLNCFRARAD